MCYYVQGLQESKVQYFNFGNIYLLVRLKEVPTVSLAPRVSTVLERSCLRSRVLGVFKLAPSSREACKYQVIAASLVQTTCETWHHGSTPTPWNQGELRRQHLTKWPNTNRSVRGGQRTEFSPSFAFALALPCL